MSTLLSFFSRHTASVGVLSILLTVFQTGCILAPAIDSFHKAGLTKSDRMQLLGKEVKEFHESLKWGDAQTALQYVEESKRSDLQPVIETFLENQHVVDSKVASSTFSEYGFDATLRVKVKSFKVGYYIVNERTDEQTWKFDMSNGWKLTSIKKGDE